MSDRFWIGFVSGAVLAGALAWFWPDRQEAPDQTRARLTVSEARERQGTRMPGAEQDRPPFPQLVQDQAGSADARAGDPEPAPGNDPATVLESPHNLALAVAGSPHVSAEPQGVASQDTKEEEENDSANLPSTAIEDYLSPGHALLIEEDRANPRNLARLHDDFIQEQPDRGAALAERLLTENLSRIAAAHGYTLTGVRCHASLCEIQSLGAGNPGWWRVMHEFMHQPASSQFGGWRWERSRQDGQEYVLTLVWRTRRSPP